MEAEDRTDEDHLRSVARGDQHAFTELFERHSDFVYNVAFRRTANWDAAEEIAENVFLELWRQRQRLTTVGGSLRPWLAGVAANQAKRWWRSHARKSRAVLRLGARAQAEADAGAVDGDPAEVVAGRVDDQRQMRALLAAVDQLPDDQRDVLTLWAWEQLSYDEIAVALGIPVGTVRSRLSRARARLRGSEGVVGIIATDGTAETDGIERIERIDGTDRAQGASIPGPPNGAAEATGPEHEQGGSR